MPKIGVKYPNSDINSLKRGDKVVCICKEWKYYTYGKTYTLYSDLLGCLCPVMDDESQYSLPTLYHPNGYYFVTPEIFREMKLNEILDRK